MFRYGYKFIAFTYMYQSSGGLQHIYRVHGNDPTLMTTREHVAQQSHWPVLQWLALLCVPCLIDELLQY